MNLDIILSAMSLTVVVYYCIIIALLHHDNVVLRSHFNDGPASHVDDLTLLHAILMNPYPANKQYTSLLWQMRIATPFFIAATAYLILKYIL